MNLLFKFEQKAMMLSKSQFLNFFLLKLLGYLTNQYSIQKLDSFYDIFYY